jgi:pyruvate/2-oxoglutarate/acetoin dehydrogenase E1 component
LSPLDIDAIVESTRKTGRLFVVDNDWVTCGASAEIITLVVERLQGIRPVRVRRMGFAPVTCPPTPTLEDLYYPNARTIAAAVYELATDGENKWFPEEKPELQEIQFKGPF